MAIQSIKILNVMNFQRPYYVDNENCIEYNVKTEITQNETFLLQFCDGINILIGENGVGKTTILKMIYAAAQCSIIKKETGKNCHLIQFFSNHLSEIDLLKDKNDRNDSYFEVSDGTYKFTNCLSQRDHSDLENSSGLNIPSVFIPTTEMLSHSKGLLALNQKYKLPFDRTQIDIVVNASLPEARELPDYMEHILDKIGQAIGGTVTMENDTFYLSKKEGHKIDFSLEAEGLRKLGLLWKLIRNGLLEKGTVLLWDEPEANLNPELFPLVVDILLELEEAGIQVFIATHSYNLAKYFEIRRKRIKQVQYHNLYKKTSSEITINHYLPENTFISKYHTIGKSEYYLSQLRENNIVDADEKLLDEVLKKSLGE